MKKLNEDLGDRMVLGLPYGAGGAIPGAVEPGVVDTFSSPDVVQNPAKFGTLVDKSKLTSNASGSMEKIAPYGPYTSENPEDYNKDVDDIKYKVTPDEVITGIEYEMKKLVLKDKDVAKQNVVRNLKKDPKYYSKLHMLGVYPEKDAAPDDDMMESKQQSAISEIIRDMYNKKRGRRNW